MRSTAALLADNRGSRLFNFFYTTILSPFFDQNSQTIHTLLRGKSHEKRKILCLIYFKNE